MPAAVAKRAASFGDAGSTHTSVIEPSKVIYVAGGSGGGGGGGSGGGNAQKATQQPATAYSIPYANDTYGGVSPGAGTAEDDARYSGYESPAMEQAATTVAGSAAGLIYAVPVEIDAAIAITRVPNPLYQPADSPSTDSKTAMRVPNPLYQPASSNVYDAGVNGNSNSNSNA